MSIEGHVAPQLQGCGRTVAILTLDSASLMPQSSWGICVCGHVSVAVPFRTREQGSVLTQVVVSAGIGRAECGTVLTGCLGESPSHLLMP